MTTVEELADEITDDLASAAYNSREAVAHHEAGHAAIAFLLGIGLYEVVLKTAADGTFGGGHVGFSLRPGAGDQAPANPGQRRLLQGLLLTTMAGAVAQRRYWAGLPEDQQIAPRRSDRDATSDDDQDAMATAMLLLDETMGGQVGIARVLDLLHVADSGVDHLLDRAAVWDAVHVMAGVLLECERLPGATVIQIVRDRCNVPSSTERRRFLERVFLDSRVAVTDADARVVQV